MLKQILLSENSAELIRENKEKIFKIIPELEKCDGFIQFNDYHIYDVLEHILHVVDGVENNYLLKIAALFHDIGKPYVFVKDENGIGHFYGHWNESIKIFDKYKGMFDLVDKEIILIKNLIFYHDLEFREDNLEEFKKVFGENLFLLASLKKADVLSQNHKYLDRLDGIDKNIKLIREK